MDWLTADLVFKAIGMMAVIWVAAWISWSAVFWLCAEGASEQRARVAIWWRTRMLLLRNLIHRITERWIAWKAREGDHSKQMERFRKAEVIANGNDGQSDRQPYRGEPLNSASAGASDQRRDPLRIVRPSAG